MWRIGNLAAAFAGMNPTPQQIPKHTARHGKTQDMVCDELRTWTPGCRKAGRRPRGSTSGRFASGRAAPPARWAPDRG